MAVRQLRNSPARAAAHAYRATMSCTTTNGQNVGLRSVLTAVVTTPVTIPTTGPAGAVARIVPVVSSESGSATASATAETARLMAAAPGMSTSSRIGSGRFREG